MSSLPHTHTNDKGLTTAEVLELQKKFGRNVIPVHRVSAFRIFLRQFRSAIIILMLIAAGISWSVQDYSGAIIILAIIVVNTFVGFYQEFRAERKLYDIGNLVQPTAIAKRDGAFKIIPREDVVKGDLIQLTAGTIAPADIELLFAEGLFMNESSITGESLPVEKSLESKNSIIQMGSIVTQGMGEGIVTAIGAEAILGEIINLAETARPTNFEKEVRKLTELCIGIIVVTATLLFIAKYFLNPAQALSIEFLIFILAIGIGILPESLPLITTVALSNGAMSLAKLGVVVRTLSAIQDLGSITVLCSDKTGTLTENLLSVSDKLICDEAAFEDLLSIAAGLQGFIHDPFQHALAGLKKEKQSAKVELLHAIPFDAQKRSASFIVSLNGDECTVTQGPPDKMIGTAKGCHDEKTVNAWVLEKESKGERVLAFRLHSQKNDAIVAYISFRDPIRSTAKKSLIHAQNLGITVKVISGDSEIVTAAVTTELGLLKLGQKVISGKDWETLSEAEKMETAKKHSAFARFYPVQKHELIHLLQKQGEIVGYMGDGVNDAPGLKLADVGISVASGTDIAKSSSDIILLKPGLGVVVSGIQHGRSIFENISKYLRETLTENMGNFLSISVLSFFIPYLPMLPIQILVTNLLSDFPQLAIATDRVDPTAIRIPRRFHLKLLLRFMFMLSLISSSADMLFFAFFHAFPEALVQSGWFIFSTFTEIFTVFSVRSRKSAFEGVGPSALLVVSSAGVIAAILGAVYIPAIGVYLHLIPIPLSMLAIILLIVTLYFFAFDLVKAKIYRRWPESY